MRSVRVDPTTRRVRYEGGALLGDMDREAQAFGLAVPAGVVSETGVAGLTLGGGMGWLRRKHGLACDNLVSVDVVTAAGELVKASESQNQDLFWAVRGGGQAIGVVTSFEFQAHPLGPEVAVAGAFYPIESASRALAYYGEFTQNCPDEISSFAILGSVPDTEAWPQELHGRRFVLFLAVYAGDVTAGEKALMPFREFEEPFLDISGAMPYVQVQQLFDEDYPKGARYYWKSRYVAGLDQGTIEALLESEATRPSAHSTIDVWQMGGAVARVGENETAHGNRSAPYLIGIEANWHHHEEDGANIAWSRKTYDDLAPFSTGGEYVNFPGFNEAGDEGVRAAYGGNYDRLAAIKAKFDPAGLFSAR
jgi:FAD/FMN-containing dehydrogenase